MFPYGNTLMPNLEYFYYLNAIYHVLIEKNEIDGDKKISRLTKDEVNKINKVERYISENISKIDPKGFYGQEVSDARRAFSIYKSTMDRMNYFDKDYKPKLKKDDQDYKTQLEKLKDTNRYKFVSVLVDKMRKAEAFETNTYTGFWKEFEDASNKEFTFSVEDNNSNDSIIVRLVKLDNIEKLDYIRRVLEKKNTEETNFITEYSVYSNIVHFYCGLSIAKISNEDSITNIFYDGFFDDEKTMDLFSVLVC